MSDTTNRERRTQHDLVVVLQQPALPHYRVPVFRKLAQRDGLELEVIYSDVVGLLNAPADGFKATHSVTRHLPGGMFWDSGQVRAVRRRADVAILSWNIRYLSLIPALLRARWRGVGTVLWGHGYSKNETNLRLWVRRRVTRLATAVLFYNKLEAKRFVTAEGEAENVFVAPNSLDQTAIRVASTSWASDAERLAQFRRLNDLDSRPTVLFVSRLERENRLEILLRASAMLVRDFPRLRVVVVGDGWGRPVAEEMARECGLEQMVRFLGPIYDEEEIAPWFLSADVFCYPANIGLSLLHAFGYGVPVVTSDRLEKQNPEIEALRPGDNGLLYSDGDPKALAHALAAVLGDAHLRERLSHGALETARHQYTVTTMVDGMEAAIRYAAAAKCRTAQEDGDGPLENKP